MSFASVENVEKGFKAVADRIGVLDSQQAEILEALDKYGKQLRSMFQSQMSSHSAAPYAGKNFWPDEAQAKIFGGMVLAVLGKRVKDDAVVKALGEGTNSAGGYTVPEVMVKRMIDMLGRFGKFRSNTIVLPMESDTAFVPMLTSDAVIYCPGEGQEITESDLSFGQVKLTAKTWAALTAVSNELTEDSIIAIGELVGRSITRAMAKKEDLCGFMGDGTSTYFGHTGIVGRFNKMIADSIVPAGIYIGSGNAYSELVLSDFRGVVALLPEEYEDSAKWYVSKKFFYSVMWKLAETAGVAGIYEILSDKKTRHFLGYPVEFVSCLPSTEANTQICALLGDLESGSYLAQRRGISVQSSEHVLFKKNQLCIRGTQRIDINVYGCGDATNPGPIVGLRTASS